MIYTMQPHEVSKYSTHTEPRPYILEVTSTSTSNIWIEFKTSVSYNYYNYNVDVNGTRLFSNINGNAIVNLPTAGVYNIELSGVYPNFILDYQDYMLGFLKMNLKQWGTQIWRDKILNPMGNYGGAGSSYTLDAYDIPDLRLVNSLDSALRNTKNPNQVINLSRWKTENVTSMWFLVADSSFKSLNLSGWNTSKVNNLAFAFSKCEIENLNIDFWDTSNVTTMEGLFRNSKISNCDISHLNVEKVTNMNHMFSTYYGPVHISLRYIKNISNWKPTSLSTANFFYSWATNTPENIVELDKIYTNWVNYLPTYTSGSHILDFGLVVCSPSVLSFRTQIINKGWTIYDGRNPNPNEP